MKKRPTLLWESIVITCVVLTTALVGVFAWIMHKPGITTQIQESLLSFSSPVPIPEQKKTVRLLFGGDLMFDRNIRLKMQQHGVDFPLHPLASMFQTYDLVIANLEGPVTDNPSLSVGSQPGSTNNFLFTFEPQIVEMLYRYNIRMVNLGNNHIHNFGTAGIETTKQKLATGNVEFFGNTETEASSSQRIVIKNFGELRVAFVGDNEFVPQGTETAIRDIQAARPLADIVTVFPHWGLEYETTANQVIQNLAHEFIDAGADLVIGAHPHVVQQHEDYKGKRIYYSLGNFVFDQYFSPETKRGLLVEVNISPDKSLTFVEYPIELLPSGQTQLIKK